MLEAVQLDEALKPLETLKADSARVLKDAVKEMDAKVSKKNSLSNEIDDVQNDVEDRRPPPSPSLPFLTGARRRRPPRPSCAHRARLW